MNVLQMCRVLTRAGYAVDLVTYPYGESPEMPGLEIHRACRIPGIRSVPVGFSKRKMLLDFVLFWKIAWLLQQRRYALVHAVEEAVFLALPFTWFGVQLVYDLDSLISDQLRYTGVVKSRALLDGIRSLERLCLARASAAITVCRSLTEAARVLRPEVQVFQIEDAPLEELIRPPDPGAVAALRAEFCLGDRRPILYTGNLESYQGLELLIGAAPLVRRRVREATIVIVGGAGDQLEDLRGRLVAEGLEDTVLAAGRRSPAEMPDWMALAEVLVSPRIQGENTPLKIYNYMHAGRPIVATDMVTHTQVLDSSTALLCPPTQEGLAEALCGALEDPEGARNLADAARRRAESEYSFAAFERKLLAAYREILSSSVSTDAAA